MSALLVDSAFVTSVKGSYCGRCPLTGRFISAAEFGDDEPLEHFLTVLDLADNNTATDADETDDSELWLDSAEPMLAQDFDYDNEPADRWAERVFRASFPHLWGDELTPSDCRDSSVARGDKIFKTLSACLIRKDNRYHDSHGHRGRFKKREWWRDLADRRRDWKQSRGVLGEWSYQPNESRVTIYAAPADYYFDEEADLQRSDIMVGTHFAWMHNYTRLCHSSINRELLHIWSNSENKH